MDENQKRNPVSVPSVPQVVDPDQRKPAKVRKVQKPLLAYRKTCKVCGVKFRARAKKGSVCSFSCCGKLGGAIRAEQMKRASKGKAYTKIKGRHAHRVIMERHLGRPLAPSEIVHHIDGNILNNDISNLELLPSQAEHVRQHHAEMMAARKIKAGY